MKIYSIYDYNQEPELIEEERDGEPDKSWNEAATPIKAWELYIDDLTTKAARQGMKANELARDAEKLQEAANAARQRMIELLTK